MISAFFKNEDYKNALSEYKKYNKKLNFKAILNPFCFKKISKEKLVLKSLLIKNLEKSSDAFLKNEDYSNALSCIQNAYCLDDKNIKIINKYINILDKLEEFDLEIILAKKVLKIQNFPQNYLTLCDIYEKMKAYNKAVLMYEKYIETSKKEMTGSDLTRLGCLYFLLYRDNDINPEYIKKSVDYFKKALDKTTDFDINKKIRIKNYISALNMAKKYSLEKVYWNIYSKFEELSADDKFTYSATCMLNGDIEGWEKNYEERFNTKSPVVSLKTDKPKWTGKENLKESSLLIRGEQGFGDSILMWGHIKRLKGLAKKIFFVVPEPLVELFNNNDDGIEIVSNTKDIKTINFDYHVSAMSVPYVLGLKKDNISVGEGYIKVDKESVEKFKKEYFNNKTFNIGIAFSGNPEGNQTRDIPLEKLKPLLKIKNVKLYCLTKDIEDKRLNKVFGKNKVLNIAKYFNNFKDTACAIENLDLVVSSDNCVLNLAGALGKKTFGLFNYHYNSRWYDLKGEDTGWFTSVKPFVNNEFNDWDLNIKKAVEEIKKMG